MWSSLFMIIAGLFLLAVVPQYYPMLGFRGVLYLFQMKNSWKITNQVFGFLILLTGIVYLLYFLLVGSSNKLLISLIVVAIISTDCISWLILRKK